MPMSAADLARRLAGEAEAVCRHYLPNGRREGAYWLVGDVHNAPGRSLFIRLKDRGDGRGVAGKWTDAATGEHGDLLDLIAARCGLSNFRDLADEARRFLALPQPVAGLEPSDRPKPRASGSPDSARRLFAMSQPIAGTVVETYLRKRGITELSGHDTLRFHPRCYYRPNATATTQIWPAMIAAVTDNDGHITGAHRTWLDPSADDKAPVETPRRAMGQLRGHAVRFGVAGEVIAAGEGIETLLSLRMILPSLPIAAALSAAHLAAFLFPPSLRRLYIARDNDPAGEGAAAALSDRAQAAGIEAINLAPALGDFNDDLRRLGIDELAAALRVQMSPQDVDRFMRRASARDGGG